MTRQEFAQWSDKLIDLYNAGVLTKQGYEEGMSNLRRLFAGVLHD